MLSRARQHTCVVGACTPVVRAGASGAEVEGRGKSSLLRRRRVGREKGGVVCCGRVRAVVRSISVGVDATDIGARRATLTECRVNLSDREAEVHETNALEGSGDDGRIGPG